MPLGALSLMKIRAPLKVTPKYACLAYLRIVILFKL